jgi:thiamine pyrophosphate-dependent acetolactate synthase large subunit-like protein
VTVVFSNAALGWVLRPGERAIASEFAPFDYAAITRAMGCDAVRVERLAELGPPQRRSSPAGRPWWTW